jgi:hypothetical protein
VVTVSSGDMASLFDEANWSLTPLLGGGGGDDKKGPAHWQVKNKL